jgi:MoaA/NifB/PqqE/SkfB family radical SAM enzyme
MCWAHSHLLPAQPHKTILPRDSFERLLRELNDLGTHRIEICGSGEPMLHPDALPMLRLVKDLGMECILITNGSRLTPEVCEELVDMGLDVLRVSINAATDEAHHAITQAPVGERTRIMSLLGRIVELREQRGSRAPFVGVTIVVQRENFGELPMLAEESARLGLDSIEFISLGINEASQSLALSFDELEEARRQVAQADAIMRAAGKTTNADSFLARPRDAYWTKKIFTQIPCHIGQFFCRVNANGDVNPCCGCSRVVGNITQQTFRELWTSQTYRAFRREAVDLPNRDEPAPQCRCYSCGHYAFLIEYHLALSARRFPELMHPAVPPVTSGCDHSSLT